MTTINNIVNAVARPVGRPARVGTLCIEVKYC